MTVLHPLTVEICISCDKPQRPPNSGEVRAAFAWAKGMLACYHSLFTWRAPSTLVAAGGFTHLTDRAGLHRERTRLARAHRHRHAQPAGFRPQSRWRAAWVLGVWGWGSQPVGGGMSFPGARNHGHVRAAGSTRRPCVRIVLMQKGRGVPCASFRISKMCGHDLRSWPKENPPKSAGDPLSPQSPLILGKENAALSPDFRGGATPESARNQLPNGHQV